MSTRTLLVVAACGLLVRIILLGTTLGTTDILYWKMWLELIREHGITGAYAHHSQLNHPPLSLLILAGLGAISERLGILVSEPLRALQVAADISTAVALWLTAGRIGTVDRNTIVAIFLMAPTAIFVSAFHGNTDSLMIALVALAILFAVQTERPGWLVGVTLAAAIGIKIVPVVLAPFFWSALGKRRTSYLTGLLIALVLIFAPGLPGGLAYVRNIAGYSPLGLPWGPAAIAQVAGLTLLENAYANVARYLILGAIATLWFLRGREARTVDLPSLCGMALLLLLTLAPGAGVQYLLWPLPFLAFRDLRLSIGYVTISSAHLFIAYTIWSRGFPWFLADPIRPAPYGELFIWSGIVAWVVIVSLTFWSLRMQPRSAES